MRLGEVCFIIRGMASLHPLLIGHMDQTIVKMFASFLVAAMLIATLAIGIQIKQMRLSISWLCLEFKDPVSSFKNTKNLSLVNFVVLLIRIL